jgi:hypothetical protein
LFALKIKVACWFVHDRYFPKDMKNYFIRSNDACIPVARNKKEKRAERFGWL